MNSLNSAAINDQQAPPPARQVSALPMKVALTASQETSGGRLKPSKAKATRAEFRCPDPACNPYLAFAVMLAAGLEGIKNNYELPDPVEEDIFEMGRERRREGGIASLPGSLDDAIACTQGSKIVRQALGDHIFENFLANKKIEWDQYRTQVTAWELEKYLPVL